MIYFRQNENVNHWKILTDTNHQKLQFWYLNEIFERTSLPFFWDLFICSIRPTLIITFVMASPPHLLSVMSCLVSIDMSYPAALVQINQNDPSAVICGLRNKTRTFIRWRSGFETRVIIDIICDTGPSSGVWKFSALRITLTWICAIFGISQHFSWRMFSKMI